MQIIGGLGTYTLPTYTRLKGAALDVRGKDSERAFSHGRVSIGDNKIDARTLELELQIVGTSDTDHQSQLDTILKNLYQTNFQFWPTASRYINVAYLDKITHEYTSGFGQSRSKLTASLRCVDPFFYATSQQTDSFSMTTNPQTVTVNNPGTADAPLIITITPTTNAADITITNTTDSNRAFRLADSLLTAPAADTINSELGTVYRGSSNALNFFSGLFLRLLPGSNSITYVGDPAAVVFKHTPRYL